MKKLIVLFLSLGIMPAYATQVIRGPYLENPTQTSITLRWQTSSAVPTWLEYGPTPRCNQIMMVTPAAYNHRAILYGLVPNQDFCYHLYVGNPAQTGTELPIDGKFRTLFSPERKIVTFLALGNTGAQPGDEESAQAREHIAKLMAQEQADFVIHTGNLTHNGLNTSADGELFGPFQALLQNTPLFVALGPNEYGPDRASADSKSFLHDNYSRYHDMTWSTATPKYYSFDTANARFIVLDSNLVNGTKWAPEVNEESAQTKWLKTTLSSAGDKWKIVVMNTSAYATGAVGPSQEIAEAWVKIFETYGVNLVLQGGDADYERSFPLRNEETHKRGVTYVTLGTAAPTPTKRATSSPHTARFVSARHYAIGKIVDRKLTFTIYSDTGKQLDKFEMYL